MLIDWLKVTLADSVDCQSINIMHCIILKTVPTKATISIKAMYRQCLSFHKSKFFPVQKLV